MLDRDSWGTSSRLLPFQQAPAYFFSIVIRTQHCSFTERRCTGDVGYCWHSATIAFFANATPFSFHVASFHFCLPLVGHGMSCARELVSAFKTASVAVAISFFWSNHLPIYFFSIHRCKNPSCRLEEKNTLYLCFCYLVKEGPITRGPPSVANINIDRSKEKTAAKQVLTTYSAKH